MLTLTISRLTSLTSDVPHGDTSPGRCLFSSAPSSPRPCITQSPSTLSCVTQIFIETHLNVPVQTGLGSVFYTKIIIKKIKINKKFLLCMSFFPIYLLIN